MQIKSSGEIGTAELIQHALTDARELTGLEIALAKDELRRDFVAAKSAAIMASTAGVLALTGLISLALALGLACGPPIALAVGLMLFAAAAALGLSAFRRLPKKPMSATALRLEDDKNVLKEHLS
jgi:protein-S-isoprenylcysteine O-methyltransferase Ste14